MKELEGKHADKLKVSDERPVKKQSTYIGSLKLEKGQKVWEMDLATRVIVEAQYEEERYVLKDGIGKSGIRKKLLTKDQCWYAVAINVKNARKKFLKRLMILKLQNVK